MEYSDKPEPLVRRGLLMEESIYKEICKIAKHHHTRNFSAYMRWLANEVVRKNNQENNGQL